MVATINIQEQIDSCLESKRNFLLSGGAGSGKTYSLVEAIKHLFTSHPTTRPPKVACITFTNVAVDEIRNRAPLGDLRVSTIHDFLWHEISQFQENLVTQFALFIQEKQSGGTYLDIDIPAILQLDTIQYQNYWSYQNGIISHDDVLPLAHQLYSAYPVLRKILCDKYDYLFIDEYQDTSPLVIDIFLNLIATESKGKLCIGLFGDRMQSIYKSGIESSPNAMTDYNNNYEEIRKEDNYRSAPQIIKVTNAIRTDSIHQNAAGTNKAVNGMVKFIYGNDVFNPELILHRFLPEISTVGSSDKTLKILSLTHSLNANNAKFRTIFDVYHQNPKFKRSLADKLFGDEPDQFAALLQKVGEILEAFENHDYKTLLAPNLLDITICSNTQKRIIAETLREAVRLSHNSGSIKDVLSLLESQQLIHYQNLLDFYRDSEKFGDFLEQIGNASAEDIENYWKYCSHNSPFSTQHGVKGAEFNTVLINSDNGRWSQYNFSKLFEHPDEYSPQTLQSRRLFYVCCSRAEQNLLVYMKEPSQSALETAYHWFGKDNCQDLDSI